MFDIVLSAVPDGRLLGIDSQTLIQIVAHIINVGVLATLMALLLYRPVRKFLKTRSDRISEQLKQAEDDMAAATELRLQYEQKMKDIDRERNEILDDARKTAVENGRRLVAEARAEADTVKERTAANVEMEWERAQDEMRVAVIEISAAMAEKLMTVSMNKEIQDKLFDETMAELGGKTWRS